NARTTRLRETSTRELPSPERESSASNGFTCNRNSQLPANEPPTALIDRFEREPRRDDGLAVTPVRDVDGVVLPIRSCDPDPQRQPAPETELPLRPQLAVEHERA